MLQANQELLDLGALINNLIRYSVKQRKEFAGLIDLFPILQDLLGISAGILLLPQENNGDLLPFAYKGLDKGAVFDYKIASQELQSPELQKHLVNPEQLALLEAKLHLRSLYKELQSTWLIKSSNKQNPILVILFSSSFDTMDYEKIALALDAIGQIINSINIHNLLSKEQNQRYFIADIKNNHKLRTSMVDGEIKSLLLFNSKLFIESILALIPCLEGDFIEIIAYKQLSSLLKNYQNGTIFLQDKLIFLMNIDSIELLSHLVPLLKESLFELFGFGKQERSIEYFETKPSEFLIELASDSIE